MLVKVIIRRTVAKGKEKEFFETVKQLRFAAMHHQGYISGETLMGARNTRDVVTISKWESLEDWETWQKNNTRNAIEKELEALQETPAQIEPYIFLKFTAAANLGFPPPLQKQKA